MGKRYFILFSLSFFFGVFFLFPRISLAADKILINELFPIATSPEVEWIELYNPNPALTDLTGYTIEDGTGSLKLLDGYSIPSLGYLVLNKGTDFSFTLNNDKDTVLLKSGVEIIDRITYGSFDDGNLLDNAQSPLSGKSLARFTNGADTDLDNADWRRLVSTKGSENLKPVYSSEIIITEVVPEPSTTTGDEYVEIFNSGSVPVDLLDWQIQDKLGSTSNYSFDDSQILNPNEYLAVYRNETGITLNDDGDGVFLLDPNSDVKNTASYDLSRRGQSFSLIENVWRWSLTLTPNTANILTTEIVFKDEEESIPVVETVESDLPINKARQEDNGVHVIIFGQVTVLPGVLSSQYFYIQDSSGGIQVYSYNKEFPTLISGDWVRVKGELSEIQNERRLKISQRDDIEIVKNEPPPVAEKIDIEEDLEQYEGEVVEIQGTISKISGSSFTVEDETGSINVVVKNSSTIEKPRLKVGLDVSVRGIVSQYKDLYRILPYEAGSVKILESEVLPESGSNEIITIILSMIIFYLWNLFLKVKKRQGNLQKSWQNKRAEERYLPFLVILAAERRLSQNILAGLWG